MNEKTKADYLRKAESFIRDHLKGESPTPKKLADALKACAKDYRPDSWRNIRRALITHQQEAGYSKAVERLQATENPTTLKGEDGKLLTPELIKQKQKRVKTVKLSDELKILTKLEANGDLEARAAIELAKITGARPCEMRGIEIKDDKIYITGAKKREGDDKSGSRGADRVLRLTHPDALNIVTNALRVLQNGASTMKQIQDRVSVAGKSCFPKRKTIPSLYSWRHQMGANLKSGSGDFDRKAIAYIMGHQATSSVDRYGNSKAKNGQVWVEPDGESIDLEAIRENHSDVPSFNTEPDMSLNTLSEQITLTPAEKVAELNALNMQKQQQMYINKNEKCQQNQESTRKTQFDSGMVLG